jgi:hypothetical protein
MSVCTDKYTSYFPSLFALSPKCFDYAQKADKTFQTRTNPLQQLQESNMGLGKGEWRAPEKNHVTRFRECQSIPITAPKA